MEVTAATVPAELLLTGGAVVDFTGVGNEQRWRHSKTQLGSAGTDRGGTQLKEQQERTGADAAGGVDGCDRGATVMAELAELWELMAVTNVTGLAELLTGASKQVELTADGAG